MSILIKGMKMPQNCLLCPFGNEFGECCVNAELEDANELTHSCPLIELPDHGDLIDRDELMKHGVYMSMSGGNLPIVYMSYIKGAKAVIPAERWEDPSHPFAEDVMMGERSEDVLI